MNRALGAALCVGSLALAGLPAGAAHAETGHLGCRVTVTKPYVTADGKLQTVGYRIGCTGPTKFRVRVWKATTGPDRVMKSGAKFAANGRLRLSLPCVDGVFYTTITDYRGNTSRSMDTRLDCDSATPSPTGGPSTADPDSEALTPGPSDDSAPAGPSPSPVVGSDLENEVVRLTNIERAKVGCGPLKHDARLHAAALAHSADMSANNYFSHTSQDGRSFADRITATGYTYTAIAENIAKGYPTAEAVVQAWMNSPGHRTNILNCTYADIGVGFVQTGEPYWTQNFGRSGD